MARRGGLLDADADAAARGVFDRLFGLVGEAAVVPETVNEEQSGYGERASLSTGADTTSEMLGGGGALEVGDLCLLENGSERNGALVSDDVVFETASEGQDGNGERVSQWALTESERLGAAAHSSEVTELPLSPSRSAVIPTGVKTKSPEEKSSSCS